MKRIAFLAVAAALCLPSGGATGTQAALRYRLFTRTQAVDNNGGWEWQSYPLGCGHFGWNVFGIAGNERIQVTHNSMMTYRNLTNSLEMRLRTGHEKPVGYERELDIENALMRVKYSHSGVEYTREYFTSYPARAGVIRLSASRKGALSFVLSAEVPFPRPFGDKEGLFALRCRLKDTRHGREGAIRREGGDASATDEGEHYKRVLAP